MRKGLWLATTAAIFAFPAIGLCQQPDAQAQPGQQPSAPARSDSVADVARRAREQKKEAPKPAKVFDNDNIPTTGGVSTVGNSPAASAPSPASPAAGSRGAVPPAGKEATSAKGERAWRDKFAQLRHKLESDQADLDIMQRELSTLNVQFYSDPVKGMQQELTRSDINDKTAKIDAMKKQIQADQQAISDAEEELRKSGGNPGWAQ